MSGYTKGPWKIAIYRNYYGFSVYSPHGPCITERWYKHERSPEQDAEMKANANLIAAAPELLEALKAMTELYVRLAGSGDCGSWYPEDDQEVKQSRAAIDKAEGL